MYFLGFSVMFVVCVVAVAVFQYFLGLFCGIGDILLYKRLFGRRCECKCKCEFECV